MKESLHIFRQYVNQIQIKEPGDVFSELDLVSTIKFLKRNNIMIHNSNQLNQGGDEDD